MVTLKSDWAPGAGSLSTGMNQISDVVGGSTGWRDISSLLASGWTASQVWVARTGWDVHLLLEKVVGPGGTGFAAALTLPEGFRPPRSLDLARTLNNGAAVPVRAAASGGLSLVIGVDLSANDAILLSFPTLAAFPTTYPGAAV